MGPHNLAVSSQGHAMAHGSIVPASTQITMQAKLSRTAWVGIGLRVDESGNEQIEFPSAAHPW